MDVSDNEGPDDLAVFLAEQMADPEFVAVYEALQRVDNEGSTDNDYISPPPKTT